MSKFAAALKAKAGTPVNAVPKPEPQAAETIRSGAREGAKHIGGYFTPAVSKQLRSLAVSEDTTVQDLLAEALNMLFQSRHLPMIAALPGSRLLYLPTIGHMQVLQETTNK